jgi:hypothetical protein
VEFEPSNARFDQLAGLAHAELSLVWIDASERDQDIGVCASGLENFAVADPLAAHAGLVIDGEHDRQHPALAVVVSDLLRGRLRWADAEVLGRGR